VKVQITLKSGAMVEFTATKITRQNNTITNEFTGLKWINDDRPIDLFYVRIEEIAAVVTVAEPDDEADEKINLPD